MATALTITQTGGARSRKLGDCSVPVESFWRGVIEPPCRRLNRHAPRYLCQVAATMHSIESSSAICQLQYQAVTRRDHHATYGARSRSVVEDGVDFQDTL